MPSIHGSPSGSGKDRLVAWRGMPSPHYARQQPGHPQPGHRQASHPQADRPQPGGRPEPGPDVWDRKPEGGERRRRPVLTIAAVAVGSALAIGTGVALDRLVLTELHAEPSAAGQAAPQDPARSPDADQGRAQPQRQGAGSPSPAPAAPDESAPPLNASPPPLKEIPASVRPTPTPEASQPDEQGGGSPDETSPGSGSPSGPETTVVSLTNQERAKAGCSTLRIDSRLVTAARRHSQDMAANNYFDHTSRNGDSPWDRMEAAGYPNPGAENIAKGYPTPAAVVEGWMNSPGHRANILNCKLRAVGVGMAQGPGGPYWTQNFGLS
jgi:uncharacterized protein YkwD